MWYLIAAAITLDPAGWTVLDETSQLDDRGSYMIGVESEGTVLNTIGRPTKASMAFNCIDGRRSVAFVWPAFLGTRDVQVRYRFDQGEVHRRFLMTLGGTTALMLGRDADRFLDGAAAAERVVIEISGYGGTAETTFLLTGADEAVVAVREACA